jgi:hypothetical protein
MGDALPLQCGFRNRTANGRPLIGGLLLFFRVVAAERHFPVESMVTQQRFALCGRYSAVAITASRRHGGRITIRLSPHGPKLGEGNERPDRDKRNRNWQADHNSAIDMCETHDKTHRAMIRVRRFA